MESRRHRFETEALGHLRGVYNAAYRLTRREEDARDLAQETMLRAYRTFDAFRSGTNAKAWLLTIMYSVFVNQYRHKRRLPPHVSIDDLEGHYAGALAAPEAPTADRVVTQAAVEAALDRLPEPFRAVVWLVDVEELTYEEAAAVLDCAVGTVRSRLFRSRRILAAALAEFSRDPGPAARKGGPA